LATFWALFSQTHLVTLFAGGENQFVFTNAFFLFFFFVSNVFFGRIGARETARLHLSFA
jgi:hypothetical protein